MRNPYDDNKNVIVKHSEIDKSVNFITKAEKGFFESRFVQREPNYFIIYLSSQSGCNQYCRMCHLTATGQTEYINADRDDFMYQTDHVFNHFESQATEEDVSAIEKIHVNLMARGEPLNNPEINNEYKSGLGLIKWQLQTAWAFFYAHYYPQHTAILKEPTIRFNLSTIMPIGTDILFTQPNTTIYYSLYSINPLFRKKWLPRASTPESAMKRLLSFKNRGDGTHNVKIHFAFIEGQNDSINDVRQLCEFVKYFGDFDFNIVRYNPFSDKYCKESSVETVYRNATIIREYFPYNKVKVIPRVGGDVKASCGTFVNSLGE